MCIEHYKFIINIIREDTIILTAFHSSRGLGGTVSRGVECTLVRYLAITATVAGTGQIADNRWGRWRRYTTAARR